MAKADWGLKRTCLSCNAKFYDMNRSPILCPKCGAAFDPEAMAVAKGIFGSRVTFAKNYDVLKDADCLAIVTEWNEFRRPDFNRMRTLMKSPVVFDGRNLYEPQQMVEEGFTYFSMGRPAVRTGGAK